jgi:hypothetical protein
MEQKPPHEGTPGAKWRCGLIRKEEFWSLLMNDYYLNLPDLFSVVEGSRQPL